MQYREYHPPHIYFEKQIYFLTVRCLEGEFYFEGKQKLILKILNEIIKKFNYGAYAWVVLKNHLHLLLRVEKDFKKFGKNLNGRISFEINQLDGVRGRKVIYQYWDHCIRDEADFWTHFNYTHQNPVKHGLCKNLTEAFDYPFSSAKQWKALKGEQWLFECFSRYPVVDFTDRDEEDSSL